MLLNLNKALISANIRWLQIFKAPLVNAPSLLYIIFIQMFFSLRSKTCNISSLGIFVRMGFVLPKIGGIFVLDGFCPEGLLSGELLSRGAFVLDSSSSIPLRLNFLNMLF